MKLRILWASPLPPVPSGVSDYAIELLFPLSEMAEVRVIRPPGIEPAGLPSSVGLAESFEGRLPGEILLLHLGNNPFHEWILPGCQMPGSVVVLHDLVLHHLLVEHTAARGEMEALESSLADEYGGAGRALAQARQFGLRGRLDPFLFPALGSTLHEAAAFITHSRFGYSRMVDLFPDRPVRQIELSAADPGVIDRRALRLETGIGESEILLMHLGFLTREKGMETVLRSIAAARALGLPVHLVIVGGGQDSSEMEELVADLHLDAFVSRAGWLEKETMMRLPAAADLGIVLRQPSAGETSAAVLRFLAAGCPVGVIGSHQYLEWPQSVAPRIAPGAETQADVLRLLRRVQMEKKGDGSLWEHRRSEARRVYLDSHRPEDGAARILEFLNSLSLDAGV